MSIFKRRQSMSQLINPSGLPNYGPKGARSNRPFELERIGPWHYRRNDNTFAAPFFLPCLPVSVTVDAGSRNCSGEQKIRRIAADRFLRGPHIAQEA